MSSEENAAPVSEEFIRRLLARAGVHVTKVVVSGNDVVVTGRTNQKTRPKSTRGSDFRGKENEPETALDITLNGKELEASIPGLPQPGLLRMDPELAAQVQVPAGIGGTELPADVLALWRQAGRSAPANTETAAGLAYDPLDAFRTS